MIVEVAGRRYPVKQLEDLSMRHAAQLQFELRSGAFDRITDLRTMEDIAAFLVEWGLLSRAERANHPNAMFLTCFVVWASRVSAGDDVSLLEAVDVPHHQVSWIREPSDRQEAPSPKAQGGRSGNARPARRKAAKRKR